MLAAGSAVMVPVAAVGAYLGLRRGDSSKAVDAVDEEPEVITWKEASGRQYGRDGYVFGDLSRGAIVKVFGKGGKVEDQAAEKAGDEQFSQVQRLTREAVRLFRARGYSGSISMAQTVAYFNESVSVKVDGPGAGEALPWETDQKAGAEEGAAALEETSDEVAAAVTNDAIAHALGSEFGGEAVADALSSGADTTAFTKEGQAGYIFTTLLARLERRAKSWQAISGVEGLDPNLTQAAQIGFALPVIKLGWGVSVSLTVSASSLMRWAEHEAATATTPA